MEGCALAGITKYVQERNISSDENIVVMLPDSGLMYSQLLFGSDRSLFDKYGPSRNDERTVAVIKNLNSLLKKNNVPFKML